MDRERLLIRVYDGAVRRIEFFLRRSFRTLPFLCGWVTACFGAEAAMLNQAMMASESAGEVEELVLTRPQLRYRLSSLQAELAKSDGLFARLPDPILLVDSRRCIARINAAAGNLFGRDALCRDLGAVMQDDGVLEATDAVLKGSGSQFAEFPLAGAVPRHFKVRVDPLPSQGVAGNCALLTLTDLTEIKRVEQMRSDFVTNASHELKAPLSTLLGFIETLQESAADDPNALPQFLPIMQQQATRMARLVDDLLSLSRIEMYEHVFPTASVQLEEILRPVVRGFAHRAATKGMRIEFEPLAVLPPIVGDPDQLSHIFQNLIDNAIKYGAPNTPIIVIAESSSKISGGVSVAVHDRGRGIAPQHLPRLTERFYRADASRAAQAGGTGLGLAIVKHAVNRHRGLLDIQSEGGRGSVFAVHFHAATMSESVLRDGNPYDRAAAQFVEDVHAVVASAEQNGVWVGTG